jgi:hypothetical protein
VPDTNPEIDVVLVLNPVTGETRVVFESPRAGSNEASELWWETGTANYFLYHPDEFYDVTLRQRRNSNGMCSPNENRRLILVGQVWGAPTYGDAFIVVACTRLSPTDFDRPNQ